MIRVDPHVAKRPMIRPRPVNNMPCRTTSARMLPRCAPSAQALQRGRSTLGGGRLASGTQDAPCEVRRDAATVQDLVRR